jgi:tetratricopeptide (TPR) repeat protein
MRILILSAVLAAMPAGASLPNDRQLSSPALYVRARAAEVGGDAGTANTGFATLLQRDPTSATFAQRSFRQALSSGDEALALKAARLLDGRHALPPDGRLLLMADAARARDWATARRQADLVQQDRLFAFLAPMLRAWIAFGAHDKDPLAALDGARGLSLAQPFVPEQRALLLIALGRTDDGIAALRSAGTTDIAAWPVRVRLLAADALARAGQHPRARGLLDGDEAALVAARAALDRDERFAVPIDSAAAGIAALLVRVATDFGRQQLGPVGLALAREATFLEPRDAGAFLTVANLLASLKEPREALAALDHVSADDPFASAAQSLRVAILSDMGDQAAALADAQRAADKRGDRDAWSRLGDVQLSLDRPAEAAAAYGRAVERARADKAPATLLWPLLLQQAAALDRAGRWAEAKPALDAALALAPDQPLVQNQVGYSLIAHRDEVARGSRLIAQASAARPDDPAITDSLGWSRFLLGSPVSAVPVLERAAAGEPAESTIAEHLGDAYWAVGRRYEARYAWRAALVTAEDKDRPRLSSKIDLGYSAATASP